MCEFKYALYNTLCLYSHCTNSTTCCSDCVVAVSGDLGTGVSLYQLECLSSPSLVSLLPHVVQHALDESVSNEYTACLVIMI